MNRCCLQAHRSAQQLDKLQKHLVSDHAQSGTLHHLHNCTSTAYAPPEAKHVLCCTAHRYKVVKQLGDGTYGNVWKAINRQTNEVVSVHATRRCFVTCAELCAQIPSAAALLPVLWGHPSTV
jgi:serine/threonine protein kinase